MGEVWEPTKNRSALSEIREALERKQLSLSLTCHGSGGYSPSCLAEPGHVRVLVLGQIFSEYFGSPLSLFGNRGAVDEKKYSF
jgi:hypothetical protein